MTREEGELLQRWPSGTEDRIHFEREGARIAVWNGDSATRGIFLTFDAMDRLRVILNERLKPERCETCGWPLASSQDEAGCRPGDCSMRPPFPKGVRP